MLGLLVQVLISWLLLWLFCKKNLNALGLVPTKKRAADLLFGFVVAALCCTLYYLSFSALAGYQWNVNPGFSASAFAHGSWYALRSVLFEELIFRGALLFILIQKLGSRAACTLSAIAFGVYHWFSTGVLGDPLQMTIVFLMTGIWGALFAIAFAKTGSLYLPIALHFGWNLVNIVVFSQGPLGKQLLSGSGGQPLGGALSVSVFLFQVFSVPLLVYIYLKLRLRKKKGRTTRGEKENAEQLQEQA